MPMAIVSRYRQLAMWYCVIHYWWQLCQFNSLAMYWQISLLWMNLLFVFRRIREACWRCKDTVWSRIWIYHQSIYFAILSPCRGTERVLWPSSRRQYIIVARFHPIHIDLYVNILSLWWALGITRPLGFFLSVDIAFLLQLEINSLRIVRSLIESSRYKLHGDFLTDTVDPKWPIRGSNFSIIFLHDAWDYLVGHPRLTLVLWPFLDTTSLRRFLCLAHSLRLEVLALRLIDLRAVFLLRKFRVDAVLQ